MFYQNPGGCLWDVDFIPEKKICLLACDDGSVRAIKIKKTEFVLEKQFSKTDCKKIFNNNLSFSQSFECKMFS